MPISSKNVNLSGIIKCDHFDPSSIVCFLQRNITDNIFEYLVISRKLKNPSKPNEGTGHYLTLIKSNDKASSQTVVTLMKSFTEEYLKLFQLALPDHSDQLIYIQREAATSKLSLMVFLLNDLKFKKLLSYPDLADGGRLARISSSKRSLCLQIKSDCMAILLNLNNANWFEGLGKNIVKIKISAESKLLDVHLWDSSSDPQLQPDASCWANIAVLATMSESLELTITAAVKDVSTLAWKEGSSVSGRVSRSLQLIWSAGTDSHSVKYLGMKIPRAGILLVAFTFFDMRTLKTSLVVDQYSFSLGLSQDTGCRLELSRRTSYPLDHLDESLASQDACSKVIADFEVADGRASLFLVHRDLTFVARLELLGVGDKVCGDQDLAIKTLAGRTEASTPSGLLVERFDSAVAKGPGKFSMSFSQSSLPPKVALLEVG